MITRERDDLQKELSKLKRSAEEHSKSVLTMRLMETEKRTLTEENKKLRQAIPTGQVNLAVEVRF